jgi:cytochrome c oxidase assembly protein subunit 15
VTTLPAPVASTSSSTHGPRPPKRPGRDGLPGWIGPALWFNLIAELGILVTGGLVRITGSGLGCTTWPQCVPGSFTPVPYQEQGWHKYVEFGNRLLVAVLIAGAVAALLAVRVWARTLPDSRRLTILGWTPLVLVFVQAVIGGISVRLALTPLSVALHFLPSILLIAASALLIYAWGTDVPPSDRRDLRWLSGGLIAVGTVVITLGTVVTGAGPHSGDASKPVRLPMNPRDVSILHADAVWLFVGLVIAAVLVTRLTDTHPALRRRVLELTGVTVLEGVVGYLQYFLHLPGALVVLHMLLAGLLAVSITGVASGVYGTRWITGTPEPHAPEPAAAPAA